MAITPLGCPGGWRIGRLRAAPEEPWCWNVNQPFNRGCLSTPMSFPCRGQCPFRGLRLMIVFGGGCLNVLNEVRGARFQPIDRGHRHHRPGRDTNRRWLMPRAGFVVGSLHRLFGPPLEAGAVGPDAMQDNGVLACDGDLGLLGADPLHQPGAPVLQGRPTFGSVQQHAGRLEQVGP
jgi:hypothetical protein